MPSLQGPEIPLRKKHRPLMPFNMVSEIAIDALFVSGQHLDEFSHSVPKISTNLSSEQPATIGPQEAEKRQGGPTALYAGYSKFLGWDFSLDAGFHMAVWLRKGPGC